MLSPHPNRKPTWLKRKLPQGSEYEVVRSVLAQSELHTVCQEAKCPNHWECFTRKTATFLLLGDTCSRNCGFCAIQTGAPKPVDSAEPELVASAAATLGLRYVVLTSVTRDDLPDGGAFAFADTIRCLKEEILGVKVEVLIPDFNGDKQALQKVVEAGPDVINHNIETVPRLYPLVRAQASYKRSLGIFEWLQEFAPQIPTKSGLMLGLGERTEEVEQVISQLVEAGCKLLTMGQYLQPSKNHLPVHDYILPDEFVAWRKKAESLGIKAAACGPFVRSSYQAAEMAIKS